MECSLFAKYSQMNNSDALSALGKAAHVSVKTERRKRASPAAK